MRDLALAIVIFGALPMVWVRPYIGVLLWSWLSYMNPHRLAYGFAYTMPFAQIVAASIFIGLLFDRDRKTFPWTPLTTVLVLFVLWMSITTTVAIYPDLAVDSWFKVIKIQLMIFVTLLLLNSRERIHWMVFIIAMSIGFYGFKGGIFSLLTGAEHRITGPPQTFIAGNNEIGFALCAILPLLRYLQLASQHRFMRAGFFAVMVLCAISILATYSRGALVALLAMLLFMVLKSRRPILSTLTVLALASVLLGFMPDKWGARMDTISEYEQDSSAMGRLNAWQFAINLASDYPVTGGGFGAFHPNLFMRYAPVPEDYHDSHSIYFEVLAEQGYVGLALFLLLLFLTFRTTASTLQKTRGDPDLRWAYDLSSMLRVSLVGYMIGGAFIGLAYFDLLYHLMAVAVATQVVAENTLSEAEDGKEKPEVQGVPVYGREAVRDGTTLRGAGKV